MIIKEEIRNEYKNIEGNIYSSDSVGYWSNLNKDDNTKLISALQHLSTREAIKKYQSWLFNIIFSPKRGAGLELLGLSGEEICVDYGCMWGALTVAAAKRCKYVLGIDQTLESLKLLDARIKEDHLDNIDLLCANLKGLKAFKNKFDFAIVNGVLEWIPEEGQIDLKSYYGKFHSKKYPGNPKNQQINFLKMVCQNLSNSGKLYLAIENKFDFKMLLGVKDPHANLLYVSFLPRTIANLISEMKLGRPYINWLYSFKGISSLLKESGFSKVNLYMCFPDYRFPERIIPYDASLHNFEPTFSARNANGRRNIKRLFAGTAEFAIFRILRANYLAPSIVAIGYK